MWKINKKNRQRTDSMVILYIGICAGLIYCFPLKVKLQLWNEEFVKSPDCITLLCCERTDGDANGRATSFRGFWIVVGICFCFAIKKTCVVTRIEVVWLFWRRIKKQHIFMRPHLFILLGKYAVNKSHGHPFMILFTFWQHPISSINEVFSRLHSWYIFQYSNNINLLLMTDIS